MLAGEAKARADAEAYLNRHGAIGTQSLGSGLERVQKLGPLIGGQLEQFGEGVRVDAAKTGAGEIRHWVALALVMSRTLVTASGAVIRLLLSLDRPSGLLTARGEALPTQVK